MLPRPGRRSLLLSFPFLAALLVVVSLRPAPLPAAPLAQIDDQLATVGRLSVTASAVAKAGSLVYLGNGPELTLLDTSDPLASTVLSTLALTGTISALQVVDGLAYMGNWDELVHVADVSDPLQPRLLDTLPISGNVTALVVSEERVFITTYAFGMYAIDVSDPENIEVIGQVKPPGFLTDMELAGTYAYVSTSAGLSIVNVADPAVMTVVSNYWPGGNAFGLDLVGTKAYVAFGDLGLRIINVADPTAPTPIRTVDTPWHTLDATVAGSRIYLAERDKGMYILDEPSLATTPLTGLLETPTSPEEMLIDGNTAYIAHGGGLSISDVTTLAAPQILGSYGVAGRSNRAVVVNDLVYIAGEEGLRIATVSTPARPFVIGTLDLPGAAYDVQVAGSRAYVLSNLLEQGNRNDCMLWVVDVSDPTAPTIIGQRQLVDQFAMRFTIANGYAYIAARGAGLLIYSLEPAANPAFQGSVQVGGSARDVVVSDGKAYVAFELGLAIVNVSDPQSPTLITSLLVPDYHQDMFIQTVAIEDTLVMLGTWELLPGPPPYIAHIEGTLYSIDVSTPAQPVLLDVLKPGDTIEDITIDGDQAYIVGVHGLTALDIADRTAPVELQKITFLGEEKGIVRANDLFFVVGREVGLRLFSRADRFVPKVDRVPTTGGSLTSRDGSVALELPPEALDTEVGVVQMDKLTPSQNSSQPREVLRSFLVDARSNTGLAIPQTEQAYTMVLNYADTPQLASTMSENDLNVAYWNGTNWVNMLPCESCSVNPYTNQITVRTTRFGEFALVGDAPSGQIVEATATATTTATTTTTATATATATATPSPTVTPTTPPGPQDNRRVYLPLVR